MSDAVMIALISAGVPTITTAITAFFQKRSNEMHAAKQSILQMILEDHVAANEGHLPTNYQNVLQEYDVYKKNGGNSFVSEKVEDYKKWFIAIEKERNENSIKE